VVLEPFTNVAENVPLAAVLLLLLLPGSVGFESLPPHASEAATRPTAIHFNARI
jgi:hypothetical protein